jgi:hypothetical protein
VPEWVWGLVLMAVSILLFAGLMALAWFGVGCWLDGGWVGWAGCRT